MLSRGGDMRAMNCAWGRHLASMLLVAVAACTDAAQAQQGYPSRQILIITPFPAGGGTDILSRIMGDAMRSALGQQAVVLNLGGAGSTMGPGRAVRATRDGHPVVIGNWTSHVGAPAVYNVSWHPLKDLEPVSMLSISTLIIAGRTNLPVAD